MKALEFKTSMVFNLVFTNSIVLLCFFFFLDYWLILFYSCSHHANFDSYRRTLNSYKNAN